MIDMMGKRLSEFAISRLLAGVARERVRLASLKAVRAYLGLVKGLREGALAAAALAFVITLFTTGLLMVVAGIIWLLPISPSQIPWLLLAGGLVLALVSFLMLYGFFDQRRWMEMAKVYEMMDALLEPADESAGHPVAGRGSQPVPTDPPIWEQEPRGANVGSIRPRSRPTDSSLDSETMPSEEPRVRQAASGPI